jgi:sugar phosphate isomerase/epimerase
VAALIAAGLGLIASVGPRSRALAQQVKFTVRGAQQATVKLVEAQADGEQKPPAAGEADTGADQADRAEPRDDRAAEQLGWRLGMQCWTLRDKTFFQALEICQDLGLKYVEAYPGQRVCADWGGARFRPGLSDEQKAAIKARLAETGITLVNYGVTGLGKNKDEARKVFDFAREMGIETICSEPPQAMMPVIDELCREYGINVAIHNHPKPSRYWDPQTVLAAVRGTSTRIGACADTGHWMRSGVKPMEALEMLNGRIVSFHLKDLNKFGTKQGAHDVPWGTGELGMKDFLEAVHDQGIRAVFSIEYEHNWGKSVPEIRRCVAAFDKYAAEILAEREQTRKKQAGGEQTESN